MTFARTVLLGIGTAALAVSASLAAQPALAADKQQSASTARVIAKTTRLRSLTIREGETLVAPEGKDLTMTIDGVGQPIVPGTYTGDIVLTPTDEYVLPYANGGPYRFRAGVFVDGAYQPGRSVSAIVQGGSVSGQGANGIRIVSREEKFNGVVVRGKSNYVVNGADIEMTGNGGNDFKGFGAAIMADDDAMLTVNNAKIHTKGAIRTAVFAGGRSAVVLNDCDIRTDNGTLPPGYRFSIAPGDMMEVPYGMGMTGNVRATNLIDEASITFNRCRIVTQGWGGLSSDGNGPTYMYVRDSHVETTESGYGAYANGEAHDYFDNVHFDVHDYGLIIGGPGSATFTNGTVVKSKRAGIMAHQGTGGGRVIIDRGSRFATAYTGIQVKGRGLTVVVDGATIEAGSGVILQTMENDDPIIAAMMSGGAGAPPPPPDGASAMPGGGAPPMASDVVMTVRNTSLKGDFLHAMQSGRMWLTVDDASVSGAIGTTLAAPRSGAVPTQETFREVGYVTNTPVAAKSEAGAFLTLAGKAIWTVGGPSHLNGIDIASDARIESPAGVVFKLDGKVMPLKPGSYRGMIEIAPR